MTPMEVSRAELLKQSQRQMARLAMWIAVGFFHFGISHRGFRSYSRCNRATINKWTYPPALTAWRLSIGQRFR
jgi:hypothetical protein